MTKEQLEIQVKLMTLIPDDKYTSGLVNTLMAQSGDTFSKTVKRVSENTINNYPDINELMGDGDLLLYAQLCILKYELGYNIV